MNTYLKAALSALLAFAILAYIFKLWSDHMSPVASKAQLESIEKMESQGAPQFTSQTIDGRPFALTEVKGKVVIVNFWASWCSPCIQEIPSLTSLVRAMNGELELVAISQDDSHDDLQAFLKAFPEMNGSHIHLLWDQDRSLMKLYGVERMPESFVLDPQQRLVKKIVGSINWHTPDSEAFVRQIANPKEKQSDSP